MSDRLTNHTCALALLARARGDFDWAATLEERAAGNWAELRGAFCGGVGAPYSDEISNIQAQAAVAIAIGFGLR